MTHLYELSEQMIGLQALMDDDECDIDLTDTLDALEGDLQVKSEGLLAFVANIGSDVDAIDHEIKRLKARKTTMTNRQDSLREYLRSNMDKADINRIDCPLFSITLSKARPVAVITNANVLPAEYTVTKTTTAPVKAEILKALKAGAEIPGAELGESKRSLTIR